MKILRRLSTCLSMVVVSTSAALAYATKPAETAWTFVVYIEAGNNLNSFAVKNINDMAHVGSSDKLNIVVQWNQPHNQGRWRYKINKDSVVVDEHLPAETNPDCVQDVVSVMRWAKEKYPAKRYALILWNHGLGILDPIWGRSPQLREIAQEGFEILNFSDKARGILFNEATHTYMNNQQLVEALKQVNEVLGKKVDLLGMDACLMAMAETGYQIRSYADVFVASQEVELAIGWNYSGFLATLATVDLDALSLAKLIVKSYENYYQPKTWIYTLSAISLDSLSYVKQSIDQIVASLQQCKQEHGQAIQRIIYNARRMCLQFNTPSYIDIHSFYSEMYRQLQAPSMKVEHALEEDVCEERHSAVPPLENILPSDYFEASPFRDTFSELTTATNTEHQALLKRPRQRFHRPTVLSESVFKSPSIEALKEQLTIGMKLIETVVVANTASQRLRQAKGISIYYPHNHIDTSYLKTEFAKESLWLEFLRDNI